MNSYILLAKEAVENYIKDGKRIEPPETLPKEFFEKRTGVFVTIKKSGKLRGCIGTYLPTRVNIAEEVIHNAIEASSKDYRFEPVQKKELSSLCYEVCILSEPEEVKNTESLDPKKFGVIIKTAPFTYPNQNVIFDGKVSFKSGLLLPDLAGIDTVEKQISIACQKGGINPEKEKIFIYRFTAEKYQ